MELLPLATAKRGGARLAQRTRRMQELVAARPRAAGQRGAVVPAGGVALRRVAGIRLAGGRQPPAAPLFRQGRQLRCKGDRGEAAQQRGQSGCPAGSGSQKTPAPQHRSSPRARLAGCAALAATPRAVPAAPVHWRPWHAAGRRGSRRGRSCQGRWRAPGGGRGVAQQACHQQRAGVQAPRALV